MNESPFSFLILFLFQMNFSNPCQARLNVCNKVRVNFKGPECLATHVEWKSNEKDREREKKTKKQNYNINEVL